MATIEQGKDIFDTYNNSKLIGNSALDRLNKSREDAFQNSVKKMLDADANKQNNINKNTNTSNDTTDVADEVEIIDNVVTTNNQDSLNRYGIRQEIVIKSDKEDSNLKARRILKEHEKASEEITIKCIGDLDYRVGFGVHLYTPFFSKYYDSLMYIKEVEHEWLNDGLFTSTLTLTPSRVMDEQEWTDSTDDSESDEEEKGRTVDDELWNKIYNILKQQIGKPYVTGATGPDSYDCSGLVCYAYNQFSDEIGYKINRTTEAMVGQGTEIDKDNKDEWQEGDLVLCKGSGYAPPGHVVIYTGNNRMIHASSTVGVIETDFSRTDVMYVRRVLPEAVSVSVYGKGSNVDIPNEYLVKFKSAVESNVSSFISNMSKYGYKDTLISICKQYNIEPYLMAGLISVESSGDPNDTTGEYKGLCQVKGSTDITSNITQGCKEYNEMCSYMGYCQTHVCLGAYNFGNGNLISACKEAGIDYKTCSIKELGEASYNYSKAHTNYNPSEKQLYPSKVFYAMSLLKDKKALS